MLWLKNKFTLSDRGTIELVLAILASAFQDFALLLPTGLIYSFIMFMSVLSIGGVNMPDSRAVFYLGGAFVCAMLILLTSWLQYNATFSASYKESSFRRLNLAEILRRISLSFFDGRNLTSLAASIMNDCAAFETSETHFIAPFGGAAIFIIFMAFPLIYIDWRMALALLWVVPAAFIIVGFSRKIQKFFSRNSSNYIDLQDKGINEFIKFNRDSRVNKYIDNLTQKINLAEKFSSKSHLFTSIFAASSYLILRLGIVSTALTGAVLFSRNSLQFTDFILFIMIALRIYDPLEIALQNFAAIIHVSNNEQVNEIMTQNKDRLANNDTINGIITQNSQANTVRLTGNNEQVNEIMPQDLLTSSGRLANNERVNENITRGKNKLVNKNFTIEFQHVNFTDNDGQEILRDISFTAREKQITILTGSGNITAAKLLLKFYDINQGEIRIGGENINQFDPEKLMSLFSIISDDVQLINSPVIENIRLGRKNASDKDVLKAAELVKLNLSRLPEGYKLSRLERQKISIARAILKDAPIVLLDERIISPENKPAITRLINNKTVIIISHNMQNFTGADKEVIL
ncbi:MAG: ABC transporter ATP-binding protein [Synergistaceae bacterium]|nr:ABC transporter ATP-binding protein [Synergistaceae bacterium]